MTIRIARNRTVRNLTAAERNLLARATEEAATFSNKLFAEMYVEAVRRRVVDDDIHLYNFLGHLEESPVSIEEFLDGEEFLGGTDLTIWPEVRKALVEINQNWWKGPTEAYSQAILCGATGTGKSEIEKITILYHVHILGCLRNPQAVYGLPRATSIVFPILAAKPHVTKKVIYEPIRKMVEDMGWFQKHMRLDKQIESEILFPEKNVRIAMGGADADSILGEATIGGCVDEINFMQMVLKSKKAEVSSGRSGLFDQAANIYETLTRRKKSRFTYQGPVIGIIVIASSTKYKGDFTDKRVATIEKNKEKGIYIYRKKQYEVVPQERFCGRTFRLLIGNDFMTDTRVLEENEVTPENCLVLDVPIEYEQEFRRTPHDALRDVIGMATTSISPFFRRRYKIHECVSAGKEEGLVSFLEMDNVILGQHGMPQVVHGHYCTNPSRPRYVHIDLAATGDRAAIAMLRFDGLKSVAREGGLSETLPICTVELACTIEPDAQNEIQFAELRIWVKQLRDVFGYPIKVVTYDGYSSRESIQQWRKEGMKTGEVSVDKTDTPYKQLRDAINDTRIMLLDNEVLIQELFELEHDTAKSKVDHPPRGGKDCADAVCGAYKTLLERRTSWIAAAKDDVAAVAAQRKEYEDRFDGDRFN